MQKARPCTGGGGRKQVDPHLKLSSKVVTVVKTQFCFKFFDIFIPGSKMPLVFNMSRTGPGLPKQGIAGRQTGRQAWGGVLAGFYALCLLLLLSDVL